MVGDFISKHFFVRCPICGNKIDIMNDQKIACEKCPKLIKSKCEMIKCNNCGYEFVPNDPKLIKFLRKMRK